MRKDYGKKKNLWTYFNWSNWHDNKHSGVSTAGCHHRSYLLQGQAEISSKYFFLNV